MRRLVVATHNPKKSGEMATILARLLPDVGILTLADFPGAPEPEEMGQDYAENAAIKSESAARFTGLPSLADDAGLEIDALDGAPGLHSKRFGGEDLPFPEKMARILSMLKGVPEEKRGARFRCCVALSLPGPDDHFERQRAANVASTQGRSNRTLIFEATCEGRIAVEPKGTGGFGYDPIFYLPELRRNMAELSAEEKHAISHRGKVLRAFAQAVRDNPGLISPAG
jgi:XTP/dITP diphosphohydrolase